MAVLPGNSRTYYSVNTLDNEENVVRYPVEFLNAIELSGIPQHRLILKKGAPIVLMRSLRPPIATNGTRAIITKLHPNLIEAKVSVGPYKNEIILIPRIPTVPPDYTIPISFKRVQFPVKLFLL